MKRILSLCLAVLMIATLFCGCSIEHSVKVSKSGKTKVSLLTAYPVEMIESLKDSEDSGLTEEDYKEIKKLETKVINGEKCYIEEDIQSFSTTKKANKHMLTDYGEEAGGYFKTFNVSTVGFKATLIEDMQSITAVYGDEMSIKLKITLPYVITKTNGSLSDDKKTVTFNLLKSKTIYAYTTKSDKGATIYFKKDYLKTNSSAFLDWNYVKGAKKYQLQYRASGEEDWRTVNTTKTCATVKNLKAGKKYTFKVTAITKSKKYTSISTSITTLKKTEPLVKTKTKTTVKLGWNKNINADGYIVYMRTSTTAKWKTVKTVKDPYTTVYTVKKLTSGKKYYFKVVSYSNENGKKVLSNGSALSVKTKK